MPTSIRTGLRAILGLLILGVGLFVLLETSARIYLFGIAGLDPRKINSVHRLRHSGYIQPSPHPDLGFELKPNVDGYLKLVPFRTNSQGLRDREYSVDKPENTFRVVVLGASITLPVGVEIERAFHSVLERELAQELAPLRVEFINFAVSAYNPSQVLAMLELKALGYDPDLILFSSTMLSRMFLLRAARPATTPFLEPPPTYPFFQSFLWKLVESRTGIGRPAGIDPAFGPTRIGVVEGWVARIVRWWSGGRDPADRTEPASPPREARGRRAAEGAGGQTVLERLADISTSTGIPVLMVRLEYAPSEKLAVDREVEAQARKLGIHYLDTRAAFEGTRTQDLWIYPLDPHPNAAAHAIFARVIADYLRSNDLLRPRKSS